MKNLNQEEWAKAIVEDTNAILIDVRTNEEVSEGIIPNAIQMDIYNPTAFMKQLETLDTTKNYYIYCHSGGRSVQACAIFKEANIANTFNLLGGFSNWNGAKTIP